MLKVLAIRCTKEFNFNHIDILCYNKIIFFANKFWLIFVLRQKEVPKEIKTHFLFVGSCDASDNVLEQCN